MTPPLASEKLGKVHDLMETGTTDPLVADLVRCVRLLESAARPAPGTSERDTARRETDKWWQNAIEAQGLLIDAPASEVMTIQPPAGHILNDLGVVQKLDAYARWPTAERVRELAREFHGPDFRPTVTMPDALVDDRVAFVSFVRERERAGKGEAAASQRMDEIQEKVARVFCPDCTPAHLCKRHYRETVPAHAPGCTCLNCVPAGPSALRDAVEKVRAPAAPAAPGDEAAREIDPIREYVAKLPDSYWRRMASNDNAGKRTLLWSAIRQYSPPARFPRPADSRERALTSVEVERIARNVQERLEKSGVNPEMAKKAGDSVRETGWWRP